MSVLTHIPLNSHHNHLYIHLKKNSGFWNYFSCENFQGSPNDLTRIWHHFLKPYSLCLSAPFGIGNYHPLASKYSRPSGTHGCRTDGTTPLYARNLSICRGGCRKQLAQIPRDDCTFSSFGLQVSAFLWLSSSLITPGAYMAECNLFLLCEWIHCIDHVYFFLYWKEMRYHKGYEIAPERGENKPYGQWYFSSHDLCKARGLLSTWRYVWVETWKCRGHKKHSSETIWTHLKSFLEPQADLLTCMVTNK